MAYPTLSGFRRSVLPLALFAAFTTGCGASADAVCDGVLQPAEQDHPTAGAGGIDALFDQDGDGAFDASNPDCVAAYAAAELDCDDANADVNGAKSEIPCNGVDDDCDETTVDFSDADSDTVCDADDACEGFDDTVDADNDGEPDGCDPCPSDALNDSDGDGTCDSTDTCTGYDDTVDSDSDGVADGCDFCVGDLGSEYFAADMTGCPGTVAWADRATLCTTGFTVCTGQQWVDRRAGSGPSYNYWVDEFLGYSGTDGACSVAFPGESTCEGGTPMRVCGATTDLLGNVCNWTQCGWNGSTVNEYFGGCDENFTAGTLCCR